MNLSTVHSELPPLFWILPAHGGAGSTTLAQQISCAAESHGILPEDNTVSPYVLVVCSDTMQQLEYAHSLLMDILNSDNQYVHILGLCIIARQKKRRSIAIDDRIYSCSDLISHIWKIRWVEDYTRMLTRELPQWYPSADHQKKKKKINLYTDPHPDIALMASEIYHYICQCAGEEGATVIGSIYGTPPVQDPHIQEK